MKKQPTTLEERIDAAVGSDTAVTAAELAALIEEVEAVIVNSEKDWMITGVVRPATVDSTLTADGLRLLLPKLQARYQRVDELEQATGFFAEREAAWRAEYDAWERERDALAEELRPVYADAAMKIAELFGRIAAHDQWLAELRRNRPASSISFRPSCMLAGLQISLTARRHFSLQLSYLIGTAAAKSGPGHSPQWQRRSPQPQCRVAADALPAIGRATMSGVPGGSRRSDSISLTTTRARPRIKRIATMQRHAKASWRNSSD